MHKVIVILSVLFLVACNNGGGSDNGNPGSPPEMEDGNWDESNWDEFEWK